MYISYFYQKDAVKFSRYRKIFKIRIAQKIIDRESLMLSFYVLYINKIAHIVFNTTFKVQSIRKIKALLSKFLALAKLNGNVVRNMTMILH